MEKTILVVSDHLHLQEGIRHGLEQISQDIRVIQTYNAGQAACRVMDRHPDMVLICDLIPAGSFPMHPVESGNMMYRVCLALLDFIRRREEELDLPRASVALITCHGQKLAAEMDSRGLTQACDRIFDVPCLGFLETVVAMLESGIRMDTAMQSLTQPGVLQPPTPVPAPSVKPPFFKDRRKQPRKARVRKQSCVVELLEGRCRKRGA